ncbi:IS30 family transposase, partial [Acinetobacter baumannii]|nr:IS30 family transposase [Acinetobacter baumannii]
RHKGKTRHKKGDVERRGKIKISNHIEERPEEANNRSRIGDWEADSVMGKTGGACLLTLVDRRTLYLKVAKIENKDS